MVVRLIFGLLLGLPVLAAPLPPLEKAIPPAQALPTLEAALQILAQRGLEASSALGIKVQGERVQVVVEAEALEAEAVAALGGEIRHRAAAHGLWEVLIPPERLPALASLPGVRFVRRPHRPQPLGTQGVALSGAAAWHTAGLRGQGIRVAVIDAEFGRLSQALAQGRLRHVVAARDYTGEGLEAGGGHGTACAEIVQAMAPEAELVLLKIDNEVQLAQAVQEAVGLGVRVISHSMAWFNTSFYDGTGVVCEIVRQATTAGILWVNAVGNFAAGAHWEGFWIDRDGDGLLDFAPGVNVNPFEAEPLKPLGFWLTWDDWPTTDQDFDLYIVHVPTGQVVASSTTTQAGAQPPIEHVVFLPTLPGPYGVVIRGHRVTQPKPLELFASPAVKLGVSVAESSVPTPADAPFVLALGAIPWPRWASGPQAAYSSQGPTNASRLNPARHVKPDLMGPDGVDTFVYGAAGFSGTSAAAPHGAGAAALVWSAHPGWTAEQVRSWLESAAVDLGPSGKDNVYGQGRLRLPLPAMSSPSLSHTYAHAGWQLVSVPTLGERAEAFGTTLWSWNGRGYEALPREAVLEPLRGYWARFSAPQTVTASGVVPTTDQSLALDRPGWHLVSSPWPYPKGAIRLARGEQVLGWAQAVAAGWVRPTLWGYNPANRQYFPAETLEPWQGYWLYAQAPGLVLRFSYAARGADLLEGPMPSAGEAPPPPPKDVLPEECEFFAAPTPWRGAGALRFWAVASAPIRALKVEVFDLSGRRVWEGGAQVGELFWHGEDALGTPVANGVYFCLVRAETEGNRTYSEMLRIVILR